MSCVLKSITTTVPQAAILQPTVTNNRGGVATSSSSSREARSRPHSKPRRKEKRESGAEETPAVSKHPAPPREYEWQVHEGRRLTELSESHKPQTMALQAPKDSFTFGDDPMADLAADIARSALAPAETLRSREMDNKAAHRLLVHLVRLKHCEKAVQTLEWMLKQPRFQQERCLYVSSLAASLSKASVPGAHRALKLHDAMHSDGVELDLIAFNTVISAAGKAGKWPKVLQLLQELREAGLKPDVFTYTSLIKACQACGHRWKQALRFLDTMKAEGVQPNVTTYTTLISCCQRAGKWEAAMRLFRQMEEAGIEADVKAYNSVISSCARGAKWEHAWEVCSGMRRVGCQPNTRTYNALISACERANEPQRALEAFRRMQRDSGAGERLKPTTITYNTLISACGKSGLLEAAMELYEEMQSVGASPDVFTLCALITACKRHNYWEAAIELVDDFSERHGVTMNTIACNSLISTLGRAGRWQYALQYFERLARGELEGFPDAWSYTGMVLAYRGGGKYQSVLDVYRDMRERDHPIYIDVFYAVLEACERLENWQQGRETLLHIRAEAAASRIRTSGLDMAAWQAVFAFPPLMESVPKPIISAARAAVGSGKLARRLVSSRSRDKSSEPEN